MKDEMLSPVVVVGLTEKELVMFRKVMKMCLWSMIACAFVLTCVVATQYVSNPAYGALAPVPDGVASQLYGAACTCDSGNCDEGSCTGGSCITSSGSQAGSPKGSRTCSSNCTCGLTINTCDG